MGRLKRRGRNTRRSRGSSNSWWGKAVDVLAAFRPTFLSNTEDSSGNSIIVMRDDTGKYDPPLGEPLQGGAYVGDSAGYFTVGDPIVIDYTKTFELEFLMFWTGLTQYNDIITNTVAVATRITQRDNAKFYIWAAGTPLNFGVNVSLTGWVKYRIVGSGAGSNNVELFCAEGIGASEVSKGKITIATNLGINRLLGLGASFQLETNNKCQYIKVTQDSVLTHYWLFETSNLAGSDMPAIVPDLVGSKPATGAGLTPADNAWRSNTLASPLNETGYNIYELAGGVITGSPIAKGAAIPADYGISPANNAGTADGEGNALVYKGKTRLNSQLIEAHPATFDAAGWIDFGSVAYVNTVTTGDWCFMGYFKATSKVSEYVIMSKGAGVAQGRAWVAIDVNGYVLCKAGGTGSATDDITGAVDVTDGAVHYFIFYKESGSIKLITDVDSPISPVASTRSLESLSDDTFSIGAGVAGVGVTLAGTSLWDCAFLAYAPSTAEITAFGVDGEIPSNAGFKPPCIGRDNQASESVWDIAGDVEGTWTSSTQNVRFSGVSNHPSAFRHILKGFDLVSGSEVPAKDDGTSPDTGLAVSNPKGWNNADVAMDFNNGDIKEITDALAGQSFDVNAYVFNDTIDDATEFERQETSVLEWFFKIFR